MICFLSTDVKKYSLEGHCMNCKQSRQLEKTEQFIKSQFSNNTKIMRNICTNHLIVQPNTEIYQVPIRKFNSTFELQLVDSFLLSEEISVFDGEIMDVVYSLGKNGNIFFTSDKVASTFSGNHNQRVAKNRLDEITRSLDKLSSICIRIDCTAELRARNHDKSNFYIYEGYLLPLERIIKFSRTGKQTILYHLLETPPLYRYAADVHQIIEVPEIFLQTQNYYSDTYEAIMIKRYVIKRVLQILNPNNNISSNRISFLWSDSKGSEPKGLYGTLGYTPDDSIRWRTKTKKMIVRIVSETLQHLKDLNVISEYMPYREHGSTNPNQPITGFCIKS